MNATAPKLKDLTSVAMSLLKNKFSIVNIGLVQDKGTQDTEIESHLNAEGACIIVAPLVTGMLRDQSGPAWILDCEIMVRVRINPERNADTGGAGLDIYDVVTKVIQGLCQAPRITGGSEFFKAAHDCLALAEFSEGIWSYNLLFTKEALI